MLLGARPDRAPSAGGALPAYRMAPSVKPNFSAANWALNRTELPVEARRPAGLQWLRAPGLPKSGWKWAAGVAASLAIVGLFAVMPMEKAVAVGSRDSVKPPETGILTRLRKGVASRAAVRLEDDFRSGLRGWSGDDGWAESWKYTDAGFVEPGKLALYQSSLDLRDYTLSFLAQVESRGLNWVFRAKDRESYYAMRLEVSTKSRVPEASLVRYAVIGGKAERPVRLPLPLRLASNTLYPVSLEIQADAFTTRIQDQVVDSFSDARLKQGGVGFFAEKGDRALLRWVSVVYQDDLIGRFCALLAPPRVTETR